MEMRRYLLDSWRIIVFLTSDLAISIIFWTSVSFRPVTQMAITAPSWTSVKSVCLSWDCYCPPLDSHLWIENLSPSQQDAPDKYVVLSHPQMCLLQKEAMVGLFRIALEMQWMQHLNDYPICFFTPSRINWAIAPFGHSHVVIWLEG